jgi:hypothetical protein
VQRLNNTSFGERQKLPTKAKFSKPCTQCGQCCRNAICPIALEVNKNLSPPCPHLSYNELLNKFGCHLVQIEAIHSNSNEIAENLGIGKGCDSFEQEITHYYQTLTSE